MADKWASSIMHADLDAFFASVEILKDPGLAGKPVIVGGTSSRGVVTSASYEARRFGVRSAMPTVRARRICPQAIFIQPDFEAYIEKSHQVRKIFDSFSHIVEPLSLDEAFLDIRRAKRMWSDPATLAEALKDRVRRATGLVISVGVAPNKLLAKLASRKAKPDGIVIVEAGRALEFLHPLPVGELWGVGDQTAQVLSRLGLKTVGDIARVPKLTLEKILGSHGVALAALAAGRDDRRVVADSPRKSAGAEETFGHDLVDPTQILQAILKLSDRVASRLRAEGTSGRTVTVKIRLSNFTTTTRSKTLPCETDNATEIFAVAKELLGHEDQSRRAIRLLGVSLSNLSRWPASEQLSLQRQAEWFKADKALDRVRFRFGDSALGFGALLSPDPYN